MHSNGANLEVIERSSGANLEVIERSSGANLEVIRVFFQVFFFRFFPGGEG